MKIGLHVKATHSVSLCSGSVAYHHAETILANMSTMASVMKASSVRSELTAWTVGLAAKSLPVESTPASSVMMMSVTTGALVDKNFVSSVQTARTVARAVQRILTQPVLNSAPNYSMPCSAKSQQRVQWS